LTTHGPQAVKAIFFDLGRVLIDFDHRKAASKIASSSPFDEKEIYDLFFDSDLAGLFEEGRIEPADFFLKVKELLRARIGFEEFVLAWNDIFFISETNRQVFELVKALRGRYRLTLLTNINVLHFEYIKKHYSLFEPFSEIIASFQEKVRKPNPLIYQKALSSSGVTPEEVFYTDDRPELVEGARKLGIRSSVFTGTETLIRDLQEQGVQLH